MGGLLRSALLAMKRLTSADTTRAPATIAPPAASRCSAFVGGAKELLEIQWLNLGGINSNPLRRVPARAGRFRTNAALQWQQASWPFVPEFPADRAFNDYNE